MDAHTMSIHDLSLPSPPPSDAHRRSASKIPSPTSRRSQSKSSCRESVNIEALLKSLEAVKSAHNSRDSGRESASRDTGRESASRDTGRESASRDTGRESASRDTGRESVSVETLMHGLDAVKIARLDLAAAIDERKAVDARILEAAKRVNRSTRKEKERRRKKKDRFVATAHGSTAHAKPSSSKQFRLEVHKKSFNQKKQHQSSQSPQP